MVLAIAGVLVGCATSAPSRDVASPVCPGVSVLRDDLEPFRGAFDSSRSRLKFVAILSPT